MRKLLLLLLLPHTQANKNKRRQTGLDARLAHFQ